MIWMHVVSKSSMTLICYNLINKYSKTYLWTIWRRAWSALQYIKTGISQTLFDDATWIYNGHRWIKIIVRIKFFFGLSTGEQAKYQAWKRWCRTLVNIQWSLHQWTSQRRISLCHQNWPKKFFCCVFKKANIMSCSCTTWFEILVSLYWQMSQKMEFSESLWEYLYLTQNFVRNQNLKSEMQNLQKEKSYNHLFKNEIIIEN